LLFRLGLVTTLYLIPAVLAATVLHELAHGVVARWFGDPTAQRAGRLTLNPIPSIDPVGTLALLLVGFGWARPVPVDPRYFRHPYRDMVLVALAGPIMNGAWAAVLALAAAVAARLVVNPNSSPIETALQYGAVISISLGLFNLLPIPPLDGSHFISGLWPRAYVWLSRFGFVLLILLVVSGTVGNWLSGIVIGTANAFLGVAFHLVG